MPPTPPNLQMPVSPPSRIRLGTRFGTTFELVAWAPDDADVDLSVACMFEHEADGASLAGGLLHLDKALGNTLTSLRTEGAFRGRELDSLLVSRPPPILRARAVLVIGLGVPAALQEDTIERACALAVAQAQRLGAHTAAFAPNLLDAGLHPLKLRVAHALLSGAFSALALAEKLRERGLAASAPLQTWSFDAGLAHFTAAASEFASAFSELSAGDMR